MVVVFVAEIGGIAPALVATAVAWWGVYRLILAPAQSPSSGHSAWWQTGAFFVTAVSITYLVRQRGRAISALRSSEMHYRSVTETASDVIITINDQSRVLSINPSVKTIFGYEPQELIGKPMVALMPERLRASHQAGFARYLATETRHISWTGVQLPGLRKDGKEIPLEISFATYSSSEGRRFIGFIRGSGFVTYGCGRLRKLS